MPMYFITQFTAYSTIYHAKGKIYCLWMYSWFAWKNWELAQALELPRVCCLLSYILCTHHRGYDVNRRAVIHVEYCARACGVLSSKTAVNWTHPPSTAYNSFNFVCLQEFQPFFSPFFFFPLPFPLQFFAVDNFYAEHVLHQDVFLFLLLHQFSFPSYPRQYFFVHHSISPFHLNHSFP